MKYIDAILRKPTHALALILAMALSFVPGRLAWNHWQAYRAASKQFEQFQSVTKTLRTSTEVFWWEYARLPINDAVLSDEKCLRAYLQSECEDVDKAIRDRDWETIYTLSTVTKFTSYFEKMAPGYIHTQNYFKRHLNDGSLRIFSIYKPPRLLTILHNSQKTRMRPNHWYQEALLLPQIELRQKLAVDSYDPTNGVMSEGDFIDLDGNL